LRVGLLSLGKILGAAGVGLAGCVASVLGDAPHAQWRLRLRRLVGDALCFCSYLSGEPSPLPVLMLMLLPRQMRTVCGCGGEGCASSSQPLSCRTWEEEARGAHREKPATGRHRACMPFFRDSHRGGERGTATA